MLMHKKSVRPWVVLDFFCLRKLKIIFGYQYDAKVSYSRIESDLLIFNIQIWEWPSIKVQKSRIKWFTKSLENPEIVQILTPEPNLKRSLGRPRYRMIDAIAQDLIDLKIISNEITTYSEIIEIFKLNQNQKAINIMYLCKLYEITIKEI